MNRVELEFRCIQSVEASKVEADHWPSVQRRRDRNNQRPMISPRQHRRKMAFYAKRPNLPK